MGKTGREGEEEVKAANALLPEPLLRSYSPCLSPLRRLVGRLQCVGGGAGTHSPAMQLFGTRQSTAD
jgi:hypothetical protein